MQIIISFLLIIMTCFESFSQNKDQIYLWPGKVPGEAKEKHVPVTAATENDNIIKIDEVTDPVMHVFLPEQSVKNGAAVIICPGGGYHILAWDLEGTEIAAER
jgi:hypothetical protein